MMQSSAVVANKKSEEKKMKRREEKKETEPFDKHANHSYNMKKEYVTQKLYSFWHREGKNKKKQLSL